MFNDYEILYPPLRLEYDNWSKQEAEQYLSWYISHVEERAQYVLQHSRSGMAYLSIEKIDETCLLSVWQWFLENAEVEAVPLEEVLRQQKAFEAFGDSFVAKTRLDVLSEYVIRDIAMLISHIFISKHPKLYWGVDAKSKRYIYRNRPIIKGFVDMRYGNPFAAVFEPDHMVHVQAVRILDRRANGSDLYNLYKLWEGFVPN
ncbi:MAG: hypothetical protein IJU78_03885 [Clostridia bacterium]|nr:hypothetical protein [Clostridia bacterium]